MDRTRHPGQRAGLTRAAVLAEARALLAGGGAGSLTMRALAERLGVAPNALYSHVGSKAALVDDLLDATLAEVREPAPGGGDPIAGLHDVMTSTYEVLLAHAELVPLYLARQGAGGPNAKRLGETMTTLLDGAGVRGSAARHALRVLVVYTIGFAALTTQPPLEAGADRKLTGDELLESFSAGLGWLLAGIRGSGSGGD